MKKILKYFKNEVVTITTDQIAVVGTLKDADESFVYLSAPSEDEVGITLPLNSIKAMAKGNQITEEDNTDKKPFGTKWQ